MHVAPYTLSLSFSLFFSFSVLCSQNAAGKREWLLEGRGACWLGTARAMRLSLFCYTFSVGFLIIPYGVASQARVSSFLFQEPPAIAHLFPMYKLLLPGSLVYPSETNLDGHLDPRLDICLHRYLGSRGISHPRKIQAVVGKFIGGQV